MKEYIFILKKCDYETGEVIRKALYFKNLEEYLMNGWEFNTPSDMKIYQALQNFYMVMNNDKN